MWVHSAISRARGALSALSSQGFRRARLPLRSVRPAGAGRRSLDPEFLLQGVRRHLPAFRKDQGQRRRRAPALQGAEAPSAGMARHRDDQMEFHQVPARQTGQGGEALRASGQAARSWRKTSSRCWRDGRGHDLMRSGGASRSHPGRRRGAAASRCPVQSTGTPAWRQAAIKSSSSVASGTARRRASSGSEASYVVSR